MDPEPKKVFVKDLLEDPKALDEICLCLDRAFKYLKNWKHFAQVLGIPTEIVKKCQVDSKESPTIKVFEYLETIKPDLTIKELRNALKEIRREDVFKMVEGYGGDDKVSENITKSPSDILDQIALELDGASSRAIGCWKKLGRKLKITRDKLKQFELPGHYNPTEELLHACAVTNPEDIPICSYFERMGRNDILGIIKSNKKMVKEIGEINVKDIYETGSKLLDEICQRLNQDIQGAVGWKRLARLLIDDGHLHDEDIIIKLEHQIAESIIPSPTKDILEWIAANREETSISSLIEALEKIDRMDGVEVLQRLAYKEMQSSLGEIRNLDDCATDKDEGSSHHQEQIGIQETDSGAVANILHEGHYKFGLEEQTISFVGRSSDKLTLKENLTQGSHQLVVLQGITGSGKTSLLKDVAHDIIKEHHRAIIYVNSRGVYNTDDLAIKILTTCGFTDVIDPVPKVIRLFTDLQRNCVLIIDNVDDMYHTSISKENIPCSDVNTLKMADPREDFKLFIRDICSYPDRGNLKVLITSNEPIDDPCLTVKHQVLKAMKHEDSAELLQSRLDNFHLSKQNAAIIIKYCGGIPLLLHGAVKTINTLNSVDEFCSILQSSPSSQRLDTVCPNCWPKDQNFSSCLEICFRRMPKSTQLALIVLSAFPAQCTKQEVMDIVAELPDVPPDELKAGLWDLKEYCFLRYDSSTEPLVLHSAIWDFGHKMGTHKASQEFQQLFNKARHVFLLFTLQSLIDCENKFFSKNSNAALEKYERKLDSIKQVVNWCIRSQDQDELSLVKNECVESFFNCAVLSNMVMVPKELKLLFYKMGQFCKSHSKTAPYFDCLVYGGSTNVQSCLCTPHVCAIVLDCAVRCFEKAESLLKSVRPEMLRKEARAEFHTIYGKCMVRQGRKVEGLDHINQGIKLLETKGPTPKERVMLAIGYNNLADAYSYLRRPAEAISTRLKHVLPTFIEVLHIHRLTAKVYCLIACDYHTLGQYQEAKKAVQLALVCQNKLFGAQRETARSYFDLGLFQSEHLQNDAGIYQDEPSKLQLYNESLANLKKALELQQNHLDSPEETAKTHREIAVVLTEIGKAEEAEQHWQAIKDCIQKMERVHIEI